jgi:hypothetical protein
MLEMFWRYKIAGFVCITSRNKEAQPAMQVGHQRIAKLRVPYQIYSRLDSLTYE